jgi:hypothetical protein
MSRMQEDGQAVAEVKAGGLAPTRAEARARRPGRWKPGRSSQGGVRGVRVGACFVSRMPEDGRVVAEAKAGGLAPAGASESRAWRLGWRRPGRSSQGGRGAGHGAAVRAVEAEVQQLGRAGRGRGMAGGWAEAEVRVTPGFKAKTRRSLYVSP